jgi:histone-lysine N-methyltransferase SETMAR
VDAAYGDKSLSISQINRIILAVKAGKNTSDQRHSNPKKTKRNLDVIAAVAASLEENRRFTVRELAARHGLTVWVVNKILGLVKKSARWVPKLMSPAQKEERVHLSEEFLKLIRRHSKWILGNIVTMDETAVSFHTPETKQQSKQWVKKGQPGPLKARVHASRTKQMVLVFFDAKGVIYTNYVPRGESVNASYIKKALARFLAVFKEKRPITSSQDWFLHWDNAPVHTAGEVQKYLTAKGIKTIPHPPYSPDLAPADFFLFPKLKSELAGISLAQDTFKTTWEGVVRSITKDEFAAAFQRWMERCEKCVRIGGRYVEK